MVHIHAEGPAFFCWIPKLFGKRVISTIHGLDWDREKWRGSVASKFIRGGEKNAVKYADIREKVHEQLIGMAKRMLEDDILSLEKIAEYSGLELAEAENL